MCVGVSKERDKEENFVVCVIEKSSHLFCQLLILTNLRFFLKTRIHVRRERETVCM